MAEWEDVVMGRVRCWVPLSERPDVIERLSQLPEGSDLNIIGEKGKYYLRVEEDNLVFLAEAGLGNMFIQPVEEFYPLSRVDYNIEDSIRGDCFAFPSEFEFRPKRIDPWKDREKVLRYTKILKGEQDETQKA